MPRFFIQFQFISISLVMLASGLSHRSYTQILRGSVIDQATKVNMEYVSVTLHRVSDSTLMSGTVTDIEGYFEISGSRDTSYYLEAQFLGYRKFRSAPLVMGSETNWGTIELELNSNDLQTIEVTGRANTSNYKIDKQVYDARQFKNAQGATAIEVLRNLPSISIDVQGAINIRGNSGFLLLINGKPVQGDPTAYLQNLPANAINDIEVITTPSARYDPDGHSGIINVLLNNHNLDNLQLSLNLQGGLPSVETYNNKKLPQRYGGDFSIDWSSRKWDISGGINYQRDDVSGRRIGYVNTYLNETLTEFPSSGERSFDKINYSARSTVKYTPNKTNEVEWGLYFGKRTQYRTADILYDGQQRSRILSNDFVSPNYYYDAFLKNGTAFPSESIINKLTYYNENLLVRRGDFFLTSLDYLLQINDNQSLSFSALYERTILGGPIDNITFSWPLNQDTLQYQHNENNNPLDGLRLQIDYTAKVQNSNLHFGYEFRHLKHPGDFIYQDRNFNTNTWILNPLFSNSILLKRSIHSVYGVFSGKIPSLQYDLGARIEYFDRLVEIAQPLSDFKLRRLNFYPSANILYNVSESISLKAGYNRRIERTTTFKMTPFPEREHNETLEQGDAELLPEYIDALEIGVIKKWGEHNFFITGYGTKVQNVINRVNNIFNDTILNRIYTNAGRAQSYGLEFGASIYPTSWFQFYLANNVYGYQIEGNLFNETIKTKNLVHSFTINSDFKVHKNLTIQAGVNYVSERITAQGEDSRFYNPSLSVRKKFSNKPFSLTLQWLNIDMGLLNSNEQRITTYRNNFFTTTNYIYEVDIFKLNVSYLINQKTSKSKQLKSEFGDREF